MQWCSSKLLANSLRLTEARDEDLEHRSTVILRLQKETNSAIIQGNSKTSIKNPTTAVESARKATKHWTMMDAWKEIE